MTGMEGLFLALSHSASVTPMTTNIERHFITIHILICLGTGKNQALNRGEEHTQKLTFPGLLSLPPFFALFLLGGLECASSSPSDSSSELSDTLPSPSCSACSLSMIFVMHYNRGDVGGQSTGCLSSTALRFTKHHLRPHLPDEVLHMR